MLMCIYDQGEPKVLSMEMYDSHPFIMITHLLKWELLQYSKEKIEMVWNKHHYTQIE